MVPVANDSTAFVRIATDMRADGYERQVALGRDKIEIARRMRGIGMRLSVPFSAYQGVVLGLLEGRQGTIYPVSYTHLDVYKRQMSPCRWSPSRKNRAQSAGQSGGAEPNLRRRSRHAARQDAPVGGRHSAGQGARSGVRHPPCPAATGDAEKGE